MKTLIVLMLMCGTAAAQTALPVTGVELATGDLVGSVAGVEGVEGPADQFSAIVEYSVLTMTFEWRRDKCRSDAVLFWGDSEWDSARIGDAWVTCYPAGGVWMWVTTTGFEGQYQDNGQEIAREAEWLLERLAVDLDEHRFTPPQLPPLPTTTPDTTPPAEVATAPEVTPTPELPTPTPTPGRRRAPMRGDLELGGWLGDLDVEEPGAEDPQGGGVEAEWSELHPTDPFGVITRVRGAIGAFSGAGLTFEVQALAGMVIGKGAIRADLDLGVGADSIGTSDPEPGMFRMPPAVKLTFLVGIDVGRPTGQLGGRVEYSYSGRTGDGIKREGHLGFSVRVITDLRAGVEWSNYLVGDLIPASALAVFARWHL